jgi:hypothetical protein
MPERAMNPPAPTLADLRDWFGELPSEEPA